MDSKSSQTTADICTDYLNYKFSADFGNSSINQSELLYNQTWPDLTMLELCSFRVDEEFKPLHSRSTLEQFRYYLTGVCGLCICLCGLVGNSMSMLILSKKLYALSTYIYLTSLAAADSLLLIFAALLTLNDILEVASEGAIEVKLYWAYTFPYFHPLVITFQTISIWLTLAFTVDRYIMICHPFQGNRFCTRGRAITVVCCLYIFGVLYNAIKFFEFETVVISEHGSTHTTATLSRLGRSRIYMKVVHLWSYLIFTFIIPWVALALLNFKLILEVKQSRSSQRRLSLGSQEKFKNRQDTTVMLVAVVIVFLACQLPALVTHTVWASIPGKVTLGGPKYAHFLVIQEVSNILVIINSAANIILYYGFSKKFRREFLHTFCRPCVSQSKHVVNRLHRKFSCPAITDDSIAITWCHTQSVVGSPSNPRMNGRRSRVGSIMKYPPSERAPLRTRGSVSFTIPPGFNPGHRDSLPSLTSINSTFYQPLPNSGSNNNIENKHNQETPIEMQLLSHTIEE